MTTARSTTLAARITLAAAAAAVTLVLCEMAARLVLPPPPEPWRDPQIVYLTDPEVRYVFAANQRGWIDEGLVTINSLGFRGPDVAIPKPPGRRRVVLLGDSVTLGWGVGDSEAFPAVAERRLRERGAQRDVDVANLAVAGYDTRQEIAVLERHLDRLQPDVVVLGFYANDLADALDDRAGSQQGGTRVATGNATGERRVLRMNPTPDDWLNRIVRRSRLAYAAGRTVKRLLGRGEWGMAKFTVEIDMLSGRDTPEVEEAWRMVGEQLEHLRDLARAHGFRVAVVALPSKEQVTGQFTRARYQSRLSAMIEPLGFLFVDPLPALAAAAGRSGPLFIPYDRNHPSATGHNIIGEVVADSLVAAGAIDDHPAPHPGIPATAGR